MSRTEPESPRDRSGVQVVQRVARILNTLKNEPDGLSLSQIAGEAGLARSTVQRLIAALEEERFVVSASPNGRFRLGPALASLAAGGGENLALEVRPYLTQLSGETSETVDLAVLEHDQVLFIDHIGAPRRLRAVSAVGALFPAHCTANGKALLAELSEEHVVRLLPEKLEQLTPNTITDRHALLAELERVRAEGVAYDREEHTLGICAVGRSIRNADGRVAAVTIPLPAQRFYGSESRILDPLIRVCDQIEHILGSNRETRRQADLV